MPDQPNPIPPDDLSRRLTIARPDEDRACRHRLVGDTYTILVVTRTRKPVHPHRHASAGGRRLRTGTTSRKCSPS
jgi:hypothetical protein